MLVPNRAGGSDFDPLSVRWSRTLMRARQLGGEAHVVEHDAGVKELGIEAEAATLAGERTPVIDATRVMEHSNGGSVSLTGSVAPRASLLSGTTTPATDLDFALLVSERTEVIACSCKNLCPADW